MKDPVHNVKRRAFSFAHDGRPLSYTIDGGNFIGFKERFWLGSGVLDCNGVEIYEKDLVYVCFKKDSRYGGKETVLSANFYNGAFWLDDLGGLLLTDEAIESLEVFGHKNVQNPRNEKSQQQIRTHLIDNVQKRSKETLKAHGKIWL